MNVLVTGGAGFIGSNVAALFLQNGHRVRVVDNLSTGYQKNIDGLGVEFIHGDVCNVDAVRAACQGVDTVVHLAASVGRQKSLDNPQEDARVNLIGTTNVLEEARKAGVGTFVYSSSAAIFGELGDKPVSEDQLQNPDSPYGVSKLAGEKQVLCYSALYGMKAICLRYFNVFGVNQRYDAYGNVIPIFAKRIFAGQPLTIYGDGEQTRDFINVKDVAKANYLSATVGAGTNVYNLGVGASITINHLASSMMAISGINVGVVYAPKLPADVLHCSADIGRIKRDLGFVPAVGIDDGLASYLRWYRENEA